MIFYCFLQKQKSEEKSPFGGAKNLEDQFEPRGVFGGAIKMKIFY